MNNPINNVTPLPIVLTPSPRIMRREGQMRDRYHTGAGKNVVRELNEGETSLDWVPRLLPLFTFPWVAPHDTRPVPAGTATAIVRPGYEGAPLGIATDTYRPIDHHAAVQDVAASTEGRAMLEGALIDGHGFHVVHAFKLDAVLPEKVAQIAEARSVVLDVQHALGDGAAPTVRGLPLISRLTLVHDHTGKGSLRASVVCYLGTDIVVGSACFTRRIHVGAGKQDVGVGNNARWLSVIDAMLDTAVLQQSAIGMLLAKAAEVPMTEKVAAAFEGRGVGVERERVSADEKKAAAERGESEPIGAIVERTALDVVIAHHQQRKGRLTWNVWARRLEGDALTALEDITGIKLPKQLFRRG